MPKIKKVKPVKPVHIKDPKKVLAGKARAAKSLRVGGKFTSNEFLEKIKIDAESVGAKDAYKFFLQNENEYAALYNTPMLTASKDITDLKKVIVNYNGTIFKNNKEVKKATAIKSLVSLNQYLKIEHNVVACWAQIEMSLAGKLNINVPSIAMIEKRIEDGEDIESIMEDYDYTIISSNPDAE